MLKSLTRNKHIFLILFLALAMRLVAINQSLWLDEAIGAEAVKNFTYHGILTDFLRSDNHPPLYYLDLKSWTAVFGFSEIALRMHSVLYGVLTVYLVYLISKKLSSNKLFHYLSTILIATSQIHIYYSHEARMYAMAAFLATLSIYSFINLISDTKDRSWWFLFSFSVTALVFTDYVPVFLLPVFPLVALVRKKPKKWWVNFVLTFLPLAILGLFWLPTFQFQSGRGAWLLQKLPGWSAVAGGANFKQAVLVWMKFVFGRISLAEKPLYYSLVGLASIPFSLSLFSAFKKRKKGFDIIWLWLVLPLVLGFLASIFFPAFIYFRFLYVVPAFYILVSWGAFNFENKNLRNAVIILLVSFNLLSWVIYVTDERQQRERWRQATSFVENVARTEEIVLFEYPEPFTPYRWYSKREGVAYGATDSIYATPEKTKAITRELVQEKDGIYYFEYLRDLSDPGRVVEGVLEDEGFKIEEVYNFEGVGQVFYYRR